MIGVTPPSILPPSVLPLAAPLAGGIVVAPAGTQDMPGISAIFNEVVANSTAVYTEEAETAEQRSVWFAQRRLLGYPVLVARNSAEVVLGFASFTDFRPNWPGFRHTVEHSVHIRADARGQGIGSLLVAALVAEARHIGKHVMLASVDAQNAPSIAMHEKLGFARVALLPQVGCKFGRWLDMLVLQKIVGETPPR